MAKEKPHPLIIICMNCGIIRRALLPAIEQIKHSLNIVPFNCPVAHELQTICPEGHKKEAIKELHRNVSFERR